MKYKKLFIMTLPRSGSTLLGQQLGINSQIFHLGESMYLETINPEYNLCSCGKISCQFLSKVLKNIRKEHSALPLLRVWQITERKYWPRKNTSLIDIISETQKKIENISFKHWLSLCPTALEKIIKTYQKHSSKKIFLDNTKLFNIGEYLATNNSDWGIIILLRDPRGIISSYKRDGRAMEDILPLCRDFMRSVKKIQNFKNVHIVKYEDFCANPAAILQTICNFIGVPFEKTMKDPFYSKKTTRGHVLKGNKVLWLEKTDLPILLNDSWKSSLNECELNKLYDQKLIVKLYRPFGYLLTKNE